MIKKYVKRPIPIEAMQFTGDNFDDLHDFCNVTYKHSDPGKHLDGYFIATIEGKMWFKKGDYVIKGVRGEFYACKQDIFEETYRETDKGVEVFNGY